MGNIFNLSDVRIPFKIILIAEKSLKILFSRNVF